MNKADEIATEEEKPKPTVDCITETEFPNLNFLQELKGLFIRQEFEKYELITGFETENRFRLFTYDGNMMLTAKENSGLLRRINLGKYRSMEINVENMNGVEVLRFERDVPMFSCLFPCCFLQTLEVFSGRSFIGSVEKIPNCMNFNFKIRDENGVAIMKIKGPSCFKEFSSCFQNVDFRIFSLETQNEICLITKEWGNIVMEGLTDADNFAIKWNEDLDVKTKSLCLGSCFLIDILSFESGGSRRTI